jgi:hypothetical protein
VAPGCKFVGEVLGHRRRESGSDSRNSAAENNHRRVVEKNRGCTTFGECRGVVGEKVVVGEKLGG